MWKAIYQAYGEVAVDNDPDGNGVTVTFNYRFPGQWVDIESGLYYNFYRYYDPKTGRYVTADPIGQDGGANIYTYVGGNPLYWIDPLGLAGTLVIHSSGSGGSSMMSGHSWINFTPDSTGTSTTYGTWGNNPGGLGDGLHENLEAGRTGDASRTTRLNDSQEKKLSDIINDYRKKAADGWTYDNPCSGFASSAWNKTTGENLSCQFGPICNPTTLKDSIIEANGGLNHNNTIKGNNGPSSGSSDSLSAGSGSSSLRSLGSSL